MSERETTYMCGACAKTADKPIDFRDVSCAVNAVLVYKDTIKQNKDGSWYAEAVKGAIKK